MGHQMEKKETKLNHETEKKIICKYSLLKKMFYIDIRIIKLEIKKSNQLLRIYPKQF